MSKPLPPAAIQAPSRAFPALFFERRSGRVLFFVLSWPDFPRILALTFIRTQHILPSFPSFLCHFKHRIRKWAWKQAKRACDTT
jgi:hypothetical protein